MVSTHVRCDASSGAVLTLRPGAFKPLDTAPPNCTVADKSAEVGTLTAGRRYLHTIAPESGAVDITKHAAVQLLYQVAHAGHEVSVYEATQLYELAKALEVFLVGLGPIGGKLKR